MSEFLNLLAAGLTSGAIYGIFGACLAVWFRVCNVLNLAVGDFAMFGAIGTAWLAQTAGLPFIVGIVVSLAGVGLAAWLFDRVVLHAAFDRGAGAHGIVGVFFYTFGLSLLLDEPCLGLAEAVARRVYDWLGEMTKTDMTILLVEENPVHAVLVADRAVRMYKGLVEQPGVASHE